jgi:Activator of Hsp90 ATPase homolog 1-like protein
VALELERVLPAAPSVVFRAVSAAEELAQWWGPEGFSVASVDFDPRVGAAYRIEMQPPEGDPSDITGQFRERPFRTESRRELHRSGWADSFSKLERYIRTSAPTS